MKNILSLFFLPMLFSSVPSFRSLPVYSPEWMGQAQLVYVKIGESDVGLAYNHWAVFLFQSRAETGSLTELVGVGFNNYDGQGGNIGASVPVPVSGDWSRRNPIARILFRGHWRKFCGGWYASPERCRLGG